MLLCTEDGQVILVVMTPTCFRSVLQVRLSLVPESVHVSHPRVPQDVGDRSLGLCVPAADVHHLTQFTGATYGERKPVVRLLNRNYSTFRRTAED